MTRRLFPWRREPREAVTPGRHAARSRPVPLPTLLHVDTAGPAAHVLASASRRPTAEGAHTHRPPRTVEHVGADEDTFPELLADMREDLAHTSGSLDPEDLAWEEAWHDFDALMAAAYRHFDRTVWAKRLAMLDAYAPGWRSQPRMAPVDLDAYAPGWRGEPRVPAADFDEARKLATGEIPVCTEVGA